MNIRFYKDPDNKIKRFGLNKFTNSIKFYTKYLTVLNHQRCIKVDNTGDEISFEPKKKIMKKYYKTYWNMKQYLPNNPKKILDIGCGLAVIDIFLFCHYYCNKNIKFYLLDKNQIDSNIHGGFKKEASFYNNFDYVQEICDNCGLKNYELVDTIENEINSSKSSGKVSGNISPNFKEGKNQDAYYKKNHKDLKFNNT